ADRRTTTLSLQSILLLTRVRTPTRFRLSFRSDLLSYYASRSYLRELIAFRVPRRKFYSLHAQDEGFLHEQATCWPAIGPSVQGASGLLLSVMTWLTRATWAQRRFSLLPLLFVDEPRLRSSPLNPPALLTEAGRNKVVPCKGLFCGVVASALSSSSPFFSHFVTSRSQSRLSRIPALGKGPA